MNKSAYFLLVLGILSALILVCFLLPDQATQSLRRDTMQLLGPVLRGADKPVTFFSRMDSKLKTLDEAQVEVTKLRQQVADLTVQNQVLVDKMLAEETGLPVHVAEDPLSAVAEGTGKVLQEFEYMKKAAESERRL